MIDVTDSYTQPTLKSGRAKVTRKKKAADGKVVLVGGAWDGRYADDPDSNTLTLTAQFWPRQGRTLLAPRYAHDTDRLKKLGRQIDAARLYDVQPSEHVFLRDPGVVPTHTATQTYLRGDDGRFWWEGAASW